MSNRDSAPLMEGGAYPRLPPCWGSLRAAGGCSELEWGIHALVQEKGVGWVPAAATALAAPSKDHEALVSSPPSTCRAIPCGEKPGTEPPWSWSCPFGCWEQEALGWAPPLPPTQFSCHSDSGAFTPPVHLPFPFCLHWHSPRARHDLFSPGTSRTIPPWALGHAGRGGAAGIQALPYPLQSPPPTAFTHMCPLGLALAAVYGNSKSVKGGGPPLPYGGG